MCILQTIESIYFHIKSLYTKGKSIIVCQYFFFFWRQNFFSFHCVYYFFSLLSIFALFRFNLSFIIFGYLLLVLLQFTGKNDKRRQSIQNVLKKLHVSTLSCSLLCQCSYPFQCSPALSCICFKIMECIA